jgi:LPXTG-motif cell wall-anchored protein
MPPARRGWCASLVRRTYARMAVVLALVAGVTVLAAPSAFAWHLNLSGHLDCAGAVALSATSWSPDPDDQAETIEISYRLSADAPWTAVTPQPDWEFADGSYSFEPVSLGEVPEQVAVKADITWMNGEENSAQTGWLSPPEDCAKATQGPTQTPTETPTQTAEETPTPTQTPATTPAETPVETPTETPSEEPGPKPAAELFSDCDGFHIILDNIDGTAPATFTISGPENLSTTETVTAGEALELVAELAEATTATFTIESEGMETITEELTFEPCDVPPGEEQEEKDVKDFKNVKFEDSGELADTGAGSNVTAAIFGILLVGGGTGLVVYSRRRRLPIGGRPAGGAPTAGAGS